MSKEETEYILSKSTFIRGLQCEKSLFFYKNTQIKRDPISAEQKALFSRGTNIGIHAWNLFPNGIDLSPTSISKYGDSVSKTKQATNKLTPVLYEPAFIYNKILVALDMLVLKDNVYHAYEVKSSTRVTATYLMDAALQYYVITKSGIELADFNIVFVNKEYVKHGGINYNEFFSIKSVLKEVLERQELIHETLEKSFAVLSQSNIPEKGIGEHCFYPYTCDYRGTCWKGMPENSVFDLMNLSKHDQFSIYRNGTVLLEQINNEEELKKEQQIQVWCAKNKKDYINKELIKECLAGLGESLYFFDIEAFMPTLPLYEGSSPFEHIPFLFSIHHLNNNEIYHNVYLADVNTDHRKEFVIAFLEATKKDGKIMVYDTGMERRILAKLIHQFPEYATEIQQRVNRIIDMRDWFLKPIFYSPLMKGSFSLKSILPALLPEMSYTQLGIAGGAAAMAAFEKLQTSNDFFEIEDLKTDLKAYCTMDTFALLKIFEKLKQLSLS